MDCMINCILFLCGVIPSHLHGFYISCTYFHRRKKVYINRFFPLSIIAVSSILHQKLYTRISKRNTGLIAFADAGQKR